MDILQAGSMLASRYRIGRRLGTGGMSEVYLAEETKSGRAVAIKILRPDKAIGPEALMRFQREARVASLIRHPNVIEIFDFGDDADRYYLVMERLEGIDLSEAIQLKGTYELDEMASILDSVLSALEAAHEHGLVHRDVKPQNIFLSRKREGEVHVKLVDFGIVQEMGGSAVHLTETGFVVGTPSYVSPEQAKCAAVDARSDLYAVGCVAFEMLCGRAPYVHSNPIKLLQAHVFAPVPSPSDFKPDMKHAAEADRFVGRALCKSPSDRYESAKEMRLALAKMISALGDPKAISRPLKLPSDSIGHNFGDTTSVRGVDEFVSIGEGKAWTAVTQTPASPPWAKLILVAALSALVAGTLVRFLL